MKTLDQDSVIGVGVTNIVSSTGDSHTIHTDIDHGDNCYIGVNVTMTNVVLKNNVWINRDTHIYSIGAKFHLLISNVSSALTICLKNYLSKL